MNKCICGGELRTLDPVSLILGKDCSDLPMQAVHEVLLEHEEKQRQIVSDLELRLKTATESASVNLRAAEEKNTIKRRKK